MALSRLDFQVPLECQATLTARLLDLYISSLPPLPASGSPGTLLLNKAS